MGVDLGVVKSSSVLLQGSLGSFPADAESLVKPRCSVVYTVFGGNLGVVMGSACSGIRLEGPK